MVLPAPTKTGSVSPYPTDFPVISRIFLETPPTIYFKILVCYLPIIEILNFYFIKFFLPIKYLNATRRLREVFLLFLRGNVNSCADTYFYARKIYSKAFSFLVFCFHCLLFSHVKVGGLIHTSNWEKFMRLHFQTQFIRRSCSFK